MTDIISPPVELAWESKDIEVGRIRAAIADRWKAWEAQYPDPSVIEAGSSEQVYMRTSTVNVIVAVDNEEDAQRAEDNLSQLSDYSPSRLLILVRNGRPAKAKTYAVRVKVEEREHTRGVAPVRLETITILAPPGNDQSLASLSSPLLIPDLPDVLYVPYGPIANNLLVSSLFELVDILIVDSVWTLDTGASFAVLDDNRTRQELADINDIAWSRLLVWRQLVAQFFDQPAALDSLDTIEEVQITYVPMADNGRCGRKPALLMAGWLATRLGWRAPGELVSFRNGWRSTLRAGEQGRSREIVLMLMEGESVDACGCVEKIQIVSGGKAQGAFEVERTSEDEITTTSELSGASPATRLVHSRCPDDRSLISQELRRLHEDPTYTASLDFATLLACWNGFLMPSYDDLPLLDYGDRGLVTVAANAEGVANLAVQTFSAALTAAWTERGAAAIALSGGSTPKRMGELLAHSDFPVPEAWEHVDIFWGDERWVPLDNPESNAGVALDSFLSKVPIPADRIHPVYEDGLDEAQAAAVYQALVEEIVPARDGVPAFDLIFLGMGDDGHTASLFPYTKGLAIRDRHVAPNYVEKFDTTRITFTSTLINGAREVVFLVTGSGKAQRLQEVLEGPIESDRLPSQLIRPVNGTLRWLVDQGAASALSGGPFRE